MNLFWRRHRPDPNATFVEQQPSPPLTFSRLREANVLRCDEAFQCHGGLEGWPIANWAMAVSGEWGEACNKLKKLARGETLPPNDIAHEIADTVIYLDLLAARLGIDLEKAVRDKFNIVSCRVNSKRFI